MKKHLSALLLFAAAAIWGFAFSAQKASEAVPPFTLGALRSLIAGVFLFAAIPFFSKKRDTGGVIIKKRTHIFTKQELLGGALCGVVLAGGTFFQQAGIAAGVDAGKASFITSLYVVLVPIYSLFVKKKAPLNVWVGIALATVGFYFLCLDGSFSIAKEDLIVLVCSFIFPLHIVIIDSYVAKCDAIKLSSIQFFVGAVLNFVLALITELPVNFSAILACLPAILFLGIMSSGVAYTLQMIGQRNVAPAAASVILSLESVFGVLGGLIFHGEIMQAREYVGCLIVFIAVIVSQIDFKQTINRKSK